MIGLLEEVRIILVEPAGPLNVGSVARIMKNMGLRELFLVNPHCNPLGDEARRMAVRAADVLEGAKVVPTLAEALTGCARAIATTARERTLAIPIENPAEALPWLLAENSKSALIFGREDSGLTNTELNYAQKLVAIPANPEYPSLNLAQAVAVCAYELRQISLSTPKKRSNTLTRPISSQFEGELATIDTLEGYYQQLESVLLKIGYLYPHTKAARMEKFRLLFNRANLTSEEVAMLRGICRQIEWAITAENQE